MELLQDGPVTLRSYELVDHLHGGYKQRFYACLSRGVSQALGNEGLAHSGIADEDDVFPLYDELQVEKVKDSGLVGFSGRMEREVELVYALLFISLENLIIDCSLSWERALLVSRTLQSVPGRL